MRTWTTAGVLIALLSAVLAFAVVIERIARTHAEHAAVDRLAGLAAGLRDDLDRGMAHHFEQVQVLAGLDQVADARDPARVRRALEHLQQSFPQFTWIGLADAQGRVVASAGRVLEGADVSARPWYAAGRDGPFVGDVHAAVMLEKLLPRLAEPWRFVDVEAPVVAAEGRRVGVLGAHLSWSWAREVETDLLATLRAEHRIEALVLARDGTVLLGPPEFEGRHWAPAGAADVYSAQAATRGKGRYPGLGWTVVVRQPREVALADYRALQRQIALTAAALLLLSLPFARWIARRLSRPLAQLTAAISRQEHLDGGALPRIAGYREVGLLSDALAALAQRQRAQDAALHELNASLERRIEERTRELLALTHHLEQLARVDTLTGLPNRRSFEERLPEAMARASRSGRPMALMFLDVDRFKHINDTLGHGAGDEVLKAMAARLAASVRGTDLVARLAGDEFVIVLESLNGADEARLVAQKVLQAVGRETTIGGQAMRLSTSIGIAFYRGGPLAAHAVVEQADRALYEAKAAGRNTFRCARSEEDAVAA